MANQPAIRRLAARLAADGIDVVGVQDIIAAGLNGGDAITLTADAARRLAQRLGVTPGPYDSGEVVLRTAFSAYGIDELTVAIEYDNVRIGNVTATSAIALAALLHGPGLLNAEAPG